MSLPRGVRVVRGRQCVGGCPGSSEVSPCVPVLSPHQGLSRKEDKRKKNVFFSSAK